MAHVCVVYVVRPSQIVTVSNSTKFENTCFVAGMLASVSFLSAVKDTHRNGKRNMSLSSKIMLAKRYENRF